MNLVAAPTGSPTTIRAARRDDLPHLVRMLADDPLGASREDYRSPLPAAYLAAFDAIDQDRNNELVVLEREQRVVGLMQITFIPYLTHQGSWRALVEGVRIDASMRGKGLGRQLFGWAIDRARQRGCAIVQLTTDKARPEALAFYRSLGFVDTHEGMKLHLPAG